MPIFNASSQARSLRPAGVDREDGQYVRMLACEDDGMDFQLSASALEELAEVLRENGTWQAPTLTMNGRMVLVDELLAGDVMKYLPPKKRRAWSEVVAEAEEIESPVRAFHRASLRSDQIDVAVRTREEADAGIVKHINGSKERLGGSTCTRKWSCLFRPASLERRRFRRPP